MKYYLSMNEKHIKTNIKITFIGNCQTITLCFYFQELLNENYNVAWVAYNQDEKFRLWHKRWSKKCKNKIGQLKSFQSEDNERRLMIISLTFQIKENSELMSSFIRNYVHNTK